MLGQDATGDTLDHSQAGDHPYPDFCLHALTFASESKIAGQRISRPASSRSWLLAMVAKVAGRWLAGVNTRPYVLDNRAGIPRYGLE